MLKVRHCRNPECQVALTPDNSYVNRRRGTAQSSCKPCGAEYAKRWRDKNRERERVRAQGYYSQHRDRLRLVYDRSRVIRKYGLTPEQIEAIRIAQSGLCAICERRKAVCVDHDHSSGLARALLCVQCNTMIGLANDDPAMLRRAASYLEAFAAATLRQVVCVKG